METRLCTAILVVLTLGWLGMTAVAPKPIGPFRPGDRLSALEQRIAQQPRDRAAIEQLAALYIELNRPSLAIALIRAAGPQLIEDPMLSHQLARAYEATDRIPAALGTANLALARCARAIGVSHVLNVTRVPTQPCDERSLASLERHRNALMHMNDWGVQHARDPRAPLAYRLAERRVSLAAFSTP